MKGDPDREVIVFTQVLGIAVQERAAFLDRVCASDEELRRKIEKLLEAHDRVGDFLEEPPSGAASKYGK